MTLGSPAWTIAFVPGSPVLEPELSGAADVSELRTACASAVRTMLAPHAPRMVVCVGAGERNHRHDPHAWGTLGGYGVDVHGPSRHAATPPTLPASLTVGQRLLERAGWRGSVLLQEVASSAGAAQCLSVGVGLPTDGTVWLVLGEGSAGRDPQAPYGLDERAESFDAAVAKAFAEGRPSGLLEIEAGLAADVGALGRAPWQVAAAAASASPRIDTQMVYDQAPFGVGYLVALWRMYPA